MDDELSDQLDRLPTEVKCTITRYTTAVSDRKALVLVNKAWSDVTLPILWKTLTTDLLHTGQRHILGLAHPASNIVKHLRSIYLLERPLIDKADRLPTLLAAIPRGQLHGFKSASPLELSTVKLLFVLHPGLQQLDLPADTISATALQSSWVTGRLAALTTIAINVQHFSSHGLQKLWTECPKLARLRLKGSSGAAIDESAFLLPDQYPVSTGSKHDSRYLADQDPCVLRLVFLGLGNITLPQRLDTMFQRIDVLAIQHLSLHTLPGISTLLEAMAVEFVKGHPRLEYLRINSLAIHTSADFTTSLCLLLNAFCGLRSLLLQCATCDKIDVNCIVHHGETLEALSVVNGGIHRRDATKSFDATDLQKIATGCLKLSQLCLNLYEIDEDRNESDVLGPEAGTVYTPTDFEQALDAISGMPKLRILRFTNPPNYRKAYHTQGVFVRFFQRCLLSGIERYGFRARADGIMRYLGERGSGLKVLAFSPVEKLKQADNPDKHGHSWPNYYYKRGEATDGDGTNIAVAMPLVYWKEEWPGASVLEELA
jgi:hypothetical protein